MIKLGLWFYIHFQTDIFTDWKDQTELLCDMKNHQLYQCKLCSGEKI